LIPTQLIMAIGDRNKKGKPTDYVTHYVTDIKIGPLCKTKHWVAGSDRKSEVTCTKCMKAANKLEYK